MDIFEDPIFVIMNNDGNIIRVQVNKTHTFKKLQTRIQNECGISLKQQCFTFAPVEPVEDEQCVGRLSSQKNVPMEMVHTEMPLEDYLKDVKIDYSKVFEQNNRPWCNKVLTFDEVEKNLEYFEAFNTKFNAMAISPSTQIAPDVGHQTLPPSSSPTSASVHRHAGLQLSTRRNTLDSNESNDVTDLYSPVDIQVNYSGCPDGSVQEKTRNCTFFDTYITIKCIDGKSSAIFVKENETIEAVMYRIQERSGLSFNRQEFTCFDERTLEEKFWEEEYKRFVAAIQCEDDMVQSFQELGISNASGAESDLTPTENEPALNNNKKEEIRLEVQTIHAISDTVCYADGNAVDLEIPCYKFLLNDELSATRNTTLSPTAISSLIPKIIECNLETLNVYNQCLSLSEYNFLTASGKIVCLTLHSCTIKDDDGNAVTVDKLFDNLRLIHKFDMHCSNNSSWFEPDTVKKMVRIISRFRKMKCFGFYGLTETFDISSFTDFVLKNSTVDIRLAFNVQLSAAYNKLIFNFMEQILRNKPKKIPRLQFPYSAEDSKYAEYDKLYRRQK